MAPTDDYKDRVTGQVTAKVTTGQIYWGSVPFVLIQIVMVGLIIAFPNLVSGGLAKKAEVDISNVKIENKSSTNDAANKADDPMEAVRRALQQDKDKK